MTFDDKLESFLKVYSPKNLIIKTKHCTGATMNKKRFLTLITLAFILIIIPLALGADYCCCYTDVDEQNQSAYIEGQSDVYTCDIDYPASSTTNADSVTPLILNSDECSTYCDVAIAGPGPTVQTIDYTITGRVYDETNQPLEGATVSGGQVDATGVASTLTNVDGFYTITVSVLDTENSITVYATHNLYAQNSQVAQLPLVQNLNFNMELRTACIVDIDCNDNDDTTTDNCINEVCVYTTVEQPPTPPTCQVGDALCCGNDLWESEIREECDGVDASSCGGAACLNDCTCARVVQCTVDSDCSQGQVCDNGECVVPSACGDGDYADDPGEECDALWDPYLGIVDYTGTCTSEDLCTPAGFPGECRCKPTPQCVQQQSETFGIECTDDCACEDLCPVGPTNLGLTPSIDEVRLDWTNDCDQTTKQYVYRCQTIDCLPSQSGMIISPELNANTDSYTDNQIMPGTSYCYQIAAQVSSATSAIFSEKNCTSSDVNDCAGGQGSYCASNAINYCDGSTALDCGGDVCVEQDNSASCEPQSSCAGCNIPIGLFGAVTGQLGLQIHDDFCFSEDVPTCYFDLGNSVNNYFQECKVGGVQIDSCYDFKTEYACQNDNNKCGFSAGECEWQTVTDNSALDELGAGVCRPTDIAKQECSRCDVDAGFDNCNTQLCELYAARDDGNSDCHYSIVGCKASDEMGCSLYDTAQQCLGSNGQESDYELKYTPLPHDGIRVGVTNVRNQSSEDQFGYGTCKWGYDSIRDANRCFKDADDNNRPDCLGFVCDTDNTPPVTTINYPSRTGLPIMLDVRVQDITEYGIRTYYRIVEKTIYDTDPLIHYPNSSTTNVYDSDAGIDIVNNANLADQEDTEFTIVYYSVDAVNNLEGITTLTLEVDSRAPTITLVEDDRTSYAIDEFEDNWFTDLSIHLEADEQSRCSAYLANDFGTGTPVQTYNNLNGELTPTRTLIYNLQDGFYNYHYTCIDEVGNQASDIIQLRIEGSKAIIVNEPTRTEAGVTIGDSVQLDITTDTFATCKYSTTDPFYQDRTIFFENEMIAMVSADGITHTAETTIYHDARNLYYFRCTIEGQIKGNRADVGWIAVDSQAPDTWHEVLADTTDPNQIWYASDGDLIVQLNCQDPALILLGDDKAFNDCQIYYCQIITDETSTNTCDTFGNPLADNKITINNHNDVYYYAQDTEGNTAELQHFKILLDKYDPVFTRVLLVDQNGYQQSTISFGSWIVNITMSEELSDIQAYYTVPSSTGLQTQELYYIERAQNNDQFELLLAVLPSTQFEGIDDQIAELTLIATDLHGRITNYNMTFVIDTKAPLVWLEPMFTSAYSYPTFPYADSDNSPYPLYEEEGIYYTNQDDLFVTGFVDSAQNILFITNNSQGTNIKESTLQQNTKHSDIATSQLSTSSDKGQDHINLLGSIGNYPGILANDYMAINGFRQNYGAYGKYYLLRSVVQPSSGGGFPYTAFIFDTPLEQDINANTLQTISVYALETPSTWFGQNLELQEGYNTFYVEAYDNNNNIGRIPQSDAFTLYVDTTLFDNSITLLPGPGSNNNANTPIQFTLTKQSTTAVGIPANLVDVTLTGNDVNAPNLPPANISTQIFNGQTIYTITYELQSPLADGSYTLTYLISDKATNNIQGSYDFEIDTQAPNTPTINFEPIGGIYHNQRWYLKEAPYGTEEKPVIFRLDFDEPTDTIEVTTVALSENGNDKFDCFQSITFNTFDCVLSSAIDLLPGTQNYQPEPDFEVHVTAQKIVSNPLDGDEDIGEGNYHGCANDNSCFFFTIDSQTPQIVNLDINSRVRDDYRINFTAEIPNENHELRGTVTLTGPGGSQTIDLTHVGRQGEYHTFNFRVPDYDGSELEGNYNFDFEICDFADNCQTEQKIVYVDLTQPSIEDLQISFDSEVIQIPGRGYVTRFDNVIISGTIADNDIKEVIFEPGDYNIELGANEPFETVVPTDNHFTKQIRLPLGQANQEEINEIRITLIDQAGYEVPQVIRIIKDQRRPEVPQFTISSRLS
ncbi:hypothetical protein GOV04_02315 [Candidatus Woesearchaeota archaeon]|nr:hypothetical protein [Candidatus Woesearchaeota archaeon]